MSKRIAYRNSFQPQLSATLSALDDKTLIVCTFAMDPFVVAFMAVWFTVAALLWSALVPLTLMAVVADPRGTTDKDWIGALVPTAMLAGGIAMVWLGRAVARDERAEMLALVTSTLQATPAD